MACLMPATAACAAASATAISTISHLHNKPKQQRNDKRSSPNQYLLKTLETSVDAFIPYSANLLVRHQFGLDVVHVLMMK
jgi:hypothetical protein